MWSQKAFKEQLGIDIEQLSDFEPKGAACAAFGVLHERGMPERALVVIGPDAVVKWSYQAPQLGELPGANLIFDAALSRPHVRPAAAGRPRRPRPRPRGARRS